MSFASNLVTLIPAMQGLDSNGREVPPFVGSASMASVAAP
jgi:hypothetical protein